jgi:hypothetical protein
MMNKDLTPMGLLGFAFGSSERMAAYENHFEIVAVAGVDAMLARIDPVAGSKTAG